MVDYGSNTSDNLITLICKVQFRFAEIKRTVLLGSECVHVVHRHGRNIILVSFI